MLKQVGKARQESKYTQQKGDLHSPTFWMNIPGSINKSQKTGIYVDVIIQKNTWI